MASVIVVATLSACGSSGTADTASTEGTPQQGGTLRVFFNDNGECIDPSQAVNDSGPRSVVRNYVESLTDQDPDTGKLVPRLASDWQVSKDAKTYTFHIRQGITFSDGEKLDAAAVVKNIETYANTPSIAKVLSLTTLNKAETVDANTVKVTFSAPNLPFLNTTASTKFGIIAPKSLDIPAQQRCSGKGVYGTGPFTLEQYDPNTKTILKRRADYKPTSELAKHQGPAYLDTIEVSYTKELAVRVGSFTSGQVDAIYASTAAQFTQNDVTQIKAAGGSIQSISIPGQATNIYPNVAADKPLSDINVRKALSYAIDRATYASTVFRKDYPVISSIYDSTSEGLVKTPENTTYDPEQANALLDKAGWQKGQDGYRYKDGRKLTIVWFDYSKKVGQELLIDQLRKVGIDLQVEVNPSTSEVLARIKQGNYDFVTTPYNAKNDANVFDLIYNTKKPGYYSGIHSLTPEKYKEAQAILEKGDEGTSKEARLQQYEVFQHFIADNYAAIPLSERTQDLATSKQLHGVRFGAEATADFTDAWISR
ncbi:ABC transporter substrate-binding protein [Bifidobacterium catulorum]|uniref:ABC transporter substrate-binding protein n=1 Tax=Bifidobacterium catulorum TaxID=1630173 RepID=UPI0013048F51|nr:ABC transporter substrate-binding protein [Bifidobacterium catulorum]